MRVQNERLFLETMEIRFLFSLLLDISLETTCHSSRMKYAWGSRENVPTKLEFLYIR